ncbi:hypothetical protein [Corallococcus sp. EGB]|nr:hypothetical protein [Corallococcus sp. EGB]
MQTHAPAALHVALLPHVPQLPPQPSGPQDRPVQFERQVAPPS